MPLKEKHARISLLHLIVAMASKKTVVFE